MNSERQTTGNDHQRAENDRPLGPNTRHPLRLSLLFRRSVVRTVFYAPTFAHTPQ